MGLRAMTITMVNKDTQPHTFDGYPAVRVLDKYRQPLPITIDPGATQVAGGFDAPAKPITIQPGHTATAALIWRNTVIDSNVVATNGPFADLAPPPARPGRPGTPKAASTWATPANSVSAPGKPPESLRRAVGRETRRHGQAWSPPALPMISGSSTTMQAVENVSRAA
jgi:hypothetical protein